MRNNSVVSQKRVKEVLKFGSSKVLKLGWRLYGTTLLVLNRQDAKSAKVILDL